MKRVILVFIGLMVLWVGGFVYFNVLQKPLPGRYGKAYIPPNCSCMQNKRTVCLYEFEGDKLDDYKPEVDGLNSNQMCAGFGCASDYYEYSYCSRASWVIAKVFMVRSQKLDR